MLKIYSKGCEHALRALAQIPLNQQKELFLVRDLCKQARVSETSTRKSFQRLVNCGILEAAPGPGGGYRLSRPADKITLLSIILGVDGDNSIEKCIMGLPHCSDKNPCPIHGHWKKIKSSILAELKDKKLTDLLHAQ